MPDAEFEFVNETFKALAERKEQRGMAVPLSRFTSRVGGGSAFFVRPNGHIKTKSAITHHVPRFVFYCSRRASIFGDQDYQTWRIVPRYTSLCSPVLVCVHISGVCGLSPPEKSAVMDIICPLWFCSPNFHIGYYFYGL